MKDLLWVGSSKDDLIDFPPDVRREAGYQLDKVQRGEQPTDFKPMHTVGSGTQEIRVRGRDGTYRVFYVAKFEEGGVRASRLPEEDAVDVTTRH